MANQIRAGLVFVAAATLLLGLAYPLLTTAGAGLLAPGGSAGSLVSSDGHIVGSRMIGQSFAGHPDYFQSRPSQTGYSADATAFSNLGPNGRDTAASFRKSLNLYLKRERPYLPDLTADQIPPSAVMTSASGIDPDIDPADARIQAHRVAEVRHLDLTKVDGLIEAHTDSRFLGILGEPVVNVLEINLALDEEGK